VRDGRYSIEERERHQLKMYSKCADLGVHLLYMTEDLSGLAAELRVSGGDNTSIEVKAAAGGLPESLTTRRNSSRGWPGRPAVSSLPFAWTSATLRSTGAR
jgi:hypothetical protein